MFSNDTVQLVVLVLTAIWVCIILAEIYAHYAKARLLAVGRGQVKPSPPPAPPAWTSQFLQDPLMAKLPEAIIPLQRLPRETAELIIAAILGSDDEMFVVTNQNMQRAKQYRMIVSVNEGGDGAVIIAEPK